VLPTGGLPKLAAILALAPAAPELAGGLASSPGAVGPGAPSVIGRGVYLSGAEPFARTPSGRRRATRTPTESCLIGFSFLFINVNVWEIVFTSRPSPRPFVGDVGRGCCARKASSQLPVLSSCVSVNIGEDGASGGGGGGGRWINAL